MKYWFKSALQCMVLLMFFDSVSARDFHQEGEQAYKNGDYARAIELWRSGEKNKDVASMHSLGEMFRKGRGLARDDAKAYLLYTYAAKQGYAPAQFALSSMLRNGQGTQKDMVGARKWALCAWGNGYQDTHKTMERLVLEFNPDDEAMKKALASCSTSATKGVDSDALIARLRGVKNKQTQSAHPHAFYTSLLRSKQYLQFVSSWQHDPDARDIREEVLADALRFGDEISVSVVLKDQKIDKTFRSSYEQSFMHLAAARKSGVYVRELQQTNFPADLLDANNRTALHIAALTGNTDAAKQLLQAGHSNYLADKFGYNALYYGLREMHKDTVSLLLDAGLQLETEQLSYILNALIREKKSEIVLLLLQKHRLSESILEDVLRYVRNYFPEDKGESQARFVEIATPGIGMLEQIIVGLLQANRLDQAEKLWRGAKALHEDTSFGERILLAAAKSGSQLLVERLLAQGYAIDTKDSNGDTPLMVAIRHQQYSLVEYLIGQRAMLETRNRVGETALLIAMKNGFIEAINLLIKHGANLYAVDNHGMDMYRLSEANPQLGAYLAQKGLLLGKDKEEIRAELDYSWLAKSRHRKSSGWDEWMNAAWQGDVSTLRLALEKKKLLPVDEASVRCAIVAIQAGKLEIVQLLLDKGMHVDSRDTRKQTLLMHAVRIGNRDIALLLLKRGANAGLIDHNKRTALMLALEYGYAELLSTLIEAGALGETLDAYYEVFSYAVVNKQTGLAAQLGKQINPWSWQDKHGRGVVWQAARDGNRLMLEYAVRHGADIDIADRAGVTPLMESVRQQRYDVATLLLNKGAKTELRTRQGDSVLHFAAKSGNVVLIRRLLSEAELLDLENSARDTALHIALDADQGLAAQQLVKAGAGTKMKNLFGKTQRDVAREKGMTQFIDTD
ncbi:MAG: ankyrin repeat domain-containing protein [Gammaproteobacteria bacterium]|nr:ankyrin repeat domain-containing protein [Gammaproteobacteria bacterium]